MDRLVGLEEQKKALNEKVSSLNDELSEALLQQENCRFISFKYIIYIQILKIEQ